MLMLGRGKAKEAGIRRKRRRKWMKLWGMWRRESKKVEEDEKMMMITVI